MNAPSGVRQRSTESSARESIFSGTSTPARPARSSPTRMVAVVKLIDVNEGWYVRGGDRDR